MKDFPFKASFSTVVRPLISEERDAYLAKASLDNISQFIPNLDSDTNSDLLLFCGNAFVANRVNKNDDYIDGETAIAISKYFVNKQVNWGHDRNKVCGCLLTYGYSEFGTDKPLTEEQVKSLGNAPFNVVVGGIVWRIVNPKLAALIEESNDPTSPEYLGVSISWELGFSNYGVGLLPVGVKNTIDAKEITDENQVGNYSKYLRANGGAGKIDENTFAYRKIGMPCLPLGVGLTDRPAASVLGIYTKIDPFQGKSEAEKQAFLDDLYSKLKSGELTKKDIENKYGIEFVDAHIKDLEATNASNSEQYKPVEFNQRIALDWKCPHCKAEILEKSLFDFDEQNRASKHTCGGWVIHPELSEEEKAFLDKLKMPVESEAEIIFNSNTVTVTAKNLSEPQIVTVIKENDKPMIKDFSELTDEVMKQVSAAEIKSLHESHANSILKMYEDKIREASDKFVAEQNAHANKLKEVEDAKAALVAKVEELSAVKAEFEKLLAEKKASVAQDLFNSRMATFDIEYELNDEERQVIAADIKDLDEAAFAKYQDKMKVMMKEKMKANKAKKACAESTASVDVDDAIDAGKKDTATVPHTSTAEETLAEKAKRVFGGDFIFIKG